MKLTLTYTDEVRQTTIYNIREWITTLDGTIEVWLLNDENKYTYRKPAFITCQLVGYHG